MESFLYFLNEIFIEKCESVDLEIADDIKKQKDELRKSEINRKKMFDAISYNFMCICIFIFAIGTFALYVYALVYGVWRLYLIAICIYLHNDHVHNFIDYGIYSSGEFYREPILTFLGHTIYYLFLNAVAAIDSCVAYLIVNDYFRRRRSKFILKENCSFPCARKTRSSPETLPSSDDVILPPYFVIGQIAAPRRTKFRAKGARTKRRPQTVILFPQT